MAKGNQVVIAGVTYPTQGKAVKEFNNRRKDLLASGPIHSGELYNALTDLYTRYCDNSPGYELNGRKITGFSVSLEKRCINEVWASHLCFKVHFSNGEIRPFSIQKAVQSLVNSD